MATFLPGAVVGEIGLYAGTARTASVVADRDAVIHRIGRDELEALSRHAPELANDVHLAMAGLLTGRLARTTALLREVAR